ncbi:MAG: DKNYY domain-containing protein [Gemmatimonadaceae bacterium]
MKPRSPLLLMGLLSLLFGCGGSDSPYHQEKGVWYFKKDALSLQKGETLTPLSKKFAKSTRTAYYESSTIADGIDVATFEALSDHYAKDKNSVWYCDTYRKGQEYFTVRHYSTPRIAGADARSFRMLDNVYARDTNRVYRNGEGFEVRDINTYERIGDQHAKDKVSGYFMRAEIKGSDGSTFAFVDGHYSKDAKHVFWSDYDSGKGAHTPVELSLLLPGADPPSFAIIKDGYAADVKQVYYEGKVLSRVPAAFRVLDNGYAVSDKSVFYRGDALKGADVASFVVLTETVVGVTARDKHGPFNYEKRVQQ